MFDIILNYSLRYIVNPKQSINTLKQYTKLLNCQIYSALYG
ncbi:protein of unknown function [Candidatus Nitrosocosmicus franklandus]|uniref:Uncharacterized protein n=1 Tax=Candidatus Nitrosocosmicus franklandianus TaxID=1798806 RepID=A0A484I609_9ARCH|nr:protein of unknown function [Candidatus Nitrosocosmicus franklandus]